MSTQSDNQADVLIAGAGMAGLMAAQQCQQHGLQTILIDKGRSVGGRMATRRIGPGRADHGAQFFTVREDAFGHWVERWKREGLVFVWSRGWSDGSLRPSFDAGHPRHAVRGGMNALAKHLAAGLEAGGATIHRGVRIAKVAHSGEYWWAESDDGLRFTAPALLLTPPVPQSLALLDAGGVTLAEGDRAALERIDYAPCLCGMFWVEGSLDLPDPGVLQIPGANASWIADNQRKGISPDARIITVHGSPEFSRAHWESEDDEALTLLQAEMQSLFDPRTRVREGVLKRWRYALPVEIYPERVLEADGLPALFFAGDAFAGPRVEGAVLSGMAAGERLVASSKDAA